MPHLQPAGFHQDFNVLIEFQQSEQVGHGSAGLADRLGHRLMGQFELEQQPQRVAVIGGGYIGVELSGVLRALGSDVTLVTLDDRVLNLFDPMISDILQQEMVKQGIEIHTDFQVTGLAQGEQGIHINSPDMNLEDFDQVITCRSTGNCSAIIERSERGWHGVREITCPEGLMRKVFIVVVNPSSMYWRVRDGLKGKQIQRL